ncbi:hypothetical protein SAMN02745823_03534 [Sporobacter termitidis DSM 10068]|uniref:Uncharacterized protein n=1 Tax=Sporobacter termitidis DSM 10068 TaxID=1123282 RepID=A0A1M5ZCR2_9FIRM|nr:hypothetical protein [Sporobacter termitidis]SHI22000.1 hypothetical protein SAMN02745823_03534 [Sporobacter termitidis DSM 10068]
MLIIELIINAIENGKINAAEGLIREALDRGIAPTIILEQGIRHSIPVMLEHYNEVLDSEKKQMMQKLQDDFYVKSERGS